MSPQQGPEGAQATVVRRRQCRIRPTSRIRCLGQRWPPTAVPEHHACDIPVAVQPVAAVGQHAYVVVLQ